MTEPGENPASQVPAARLRVAIRGAVQGVGFRPFVFRLAGELKLNGWVANTPQGVSIEAEGPPAALREFLLKLAREKPPRSSIHSLEPSFLDAAGLPPGFEIRESTGGEEKTAVVMPDIATCPECLAEVLDPRNRRFRYPFTNCTNCGPRYSLIEALPYDRPNTTMRAFEMCPECRAEYGDPRDRRFHAQPNACPACGPRLALWNPAGQRLASGDAALRGAAAAIRKGHIVAVKGLGGFQLIVDAWNDGAVEHLRHAKEREEKPFALMYHSLEALKKSCEVSPLEARLLASPESPIVLLRRKPGQEGACAGVAPGNPHLGVMLPYTPLHHLLMAELGLPVVRRAETAPTSPSSPTSATRSSGSRASLRSSSSTTAPSRGTWMTPSCGSSSTGNWSCAGRAATPPCRCPFPAPPDRSSPWARTSRTRLPSRGTAGPSYPSTSATWRPPRRTEPSGTPWRR